MNIFLGVVIGLIVLMILVTGHEFGHFIMARRSGVTVKEFGIGFPPRAVAWAKGKDGKWHKIPRKDWRRPRKGLVFSLNFLPIGGFCSMDGESDADTKPGTFGSVSFWKKTKILFGGVAMNWLMAFVILTVLAFTGMPKFIENQFFIGSDTRIDSQPVRVVRVVEDSPAAKAGLLDNDEIISASSVDGGEDVAAISPTDLITFNNTHAGEEVLYKIKRGDDEFDTKIKLNGTDAEYLLGVTMGQEGQTTYRSTWSAPIVGAVTTLQLTGETFKGFGTIVYNLFSGAVSQFSADETTREQGRTEIGKAGDSFTGPVGILGTLFPNFVASGFNNTAFLAALISVSLACMNVLPIPALDGGRWLMIAIARLRGKRLSQETEQKVIYYAFLFLIALAILITALDVMRLFR
ncbi:site-2 protease family protein [Candidatus Saccharibacteria bacterium]|nr:site-2 protease family protein [Candidatus Saccharibacteria bacterium]